MFRKYAFSGLLALAGCCVLPGVVTAQTHFQGIQVDLSKGGKSTTVFLAEGKPNDSVAGLWVKDTVRTALDSAIQDAFKNTGAYLVDSGSQLSRHNQMGITELLQNGDISTSSFLRGNTASFKVSTNTGILGGALDPQFKITYDLWAIILIKQSPSGDFYARGEVKMINLRLDTQNASADVLKAVDYVINSFTGKDFITKAEGNIFKREGDISGYLKPLMDRINKALAQGRKAGLKMTKKVDPKTNRLLITFK